VTTLVYCGSLGSTAAMWEPQLAAFPADHIFELPGHGAAPVVDDVTVDSLAAHILETVDGSFSYVGLSLGAAIGMRVAGAAPERVEKLVLACTSVQFGEPAQWLERAATVRAEGLEAIVDAVMARWFTPDFGDVDRWRAMFLSVDREGYARCCEALAGRNGEADLARITASTLIIAGTEDPTSPPAEAAKIAALVPGSRIELIHGAAHLANVGQPEAFNQLLEEHL
jgi:3-oxoadipate enol-lactonase